MAVIALDVVSKAPPIFSHKARKKVSPGAALAFDYKPNQGQNMSFAADQAESTLCDSV
jgi:hypothetical protein